MSFQAVVYNMDETSIYIDMMQFSHIIIHWRKNTEAYTTGNLKTKISVVITISSEGTVLRGMAILKGLKKPPKCHVPNNLQSGAKSYDTPFFLKKNVTVSMLKKSIKHL
jgi:hypothetical protein